MSHDKVKEASLAVLSRYTGMLVYPEHSFVQDPHFERLVSLDAVETQYCTCRIQFWQIKLLCQYFYVFEILIQIQGARLRFTRKLWNMAID